MIIFHSKHMTHIRRVTPVIALLAVLSVGAKAEEKMSDATDNKNYIRLGFGINIGDDVSFAGSSNDRGSVCDEFINPSYADIDGCTTADRGAGDDWADHFSDASGRVANIAIGREIWPNRFAGKVKIELEYLFRQTNYNQTVPVSDAQGATLGKVQGELQQAEERLGTVESDNYFANLYYAFARDSRWAPYVGVGLGYGTNRAEWSSKWARNPDPAQITTGSDRPNAEEIRNNLAGTVSVAATELEDDSMAYQFLAGIDYQLTTNASIGFQGRYVEYTDDFTDSVVYDPLRSHAPNLRRDGSEPVRGRMRTDDLNFYAFAITLTQNF